MKKTFIAACLFVCFAGAGYPQNMSGKAGITADAYGRVAIRQSAAPRGELAPVVFDHWVHRSRFTCRLCHVDIGFEMTAGTTTLSATDNMQGRYCGTCHDGRMKFDGNVVFASCAKEAAKEDIGRCEKCHSPKKDPGREAAFQRFARKMPGDSYGNGINWEKAEAEGLIALTDSLEGVFKKRTPLPARKDFALEAKLAGIPEILFSHRKHTVWNGCEMCHPDLFSVSRGATKYTMVAISAGQYCGVCHDKVAFPVRDCQKCHLGPVNF
jgi:c(7)-type cytochrome triheme protein